MTLAVPMILARPNAALPRLVAFFPHRNQADRDGSTSRSPSASLDPLRLAWEEASQLLRRPLAEPGADRDQFWPGLAGQEKGRARWRGADSRYARG